MKKFAFCVGAGLGLLAMSLSAGDYQRGYDDRGGYEDDQGDDWDR